MDFDKKLLNTIYSLGKNKKTGEWQVGMWTNQTLWSVDGKNERICKFKDMTRWKYFKEVREHESLIELKKGDRVLLPSARGINECYYVIDNTSPQGVGFKYLVGV